MAVKRALVADDEPLVRSLFEAALETRDYEATSVPDGQAAIDTFEPGKFDLVILDIKMPLMDGMEALARLRARDTSVPVILATGHGEDKERKEGEALGAVFLQKPFSLQVLFAALDILEQGESPFVNAGAQAGEGRRAIATPADRRRQLRAPVQLPGKVREAPTVQNPSPSFCDCCIQDISLGGGGLRFETSVPFPVGEVINLAFRWPKWAEDLTTRERVAWRDERACGAEFLDLSDQVRSQIENIVVEALRQSTSASEIYIR